MKCPRVIVATLIAIATIKSAWAQTVIHITGSAAYRAAVYGVPYSAANVEGKGATGFTAQYKYWGYEHLFYRTTFGGNGLTVAKQLVSDLTTTSARISGILSSMHVSRDTDGGAIETGGKPGN
jgi:hypothetical protein